MREMVDAGEVEVRPRFFSDVTHMTKAGNQILTLMNLHDDTSHVLDYRKVRKIIIDDCIAEHVNLLESLIGKLAHRLMQLPGVLSVRVRIVLETGLW